MQAFPRQYSANWAQMYVDMHIKSVSECNTTLALPFSTRHHQSGLLQLCTASITNCTPTAFSHACLHNTNCNSTAVTIISMCRERIPTTVCKYFLKILNVCVLFLFSTSGGFQNEVQICTYSKNGPVCTVIF